jgi:ABC-type polysaccharide/polyol phosphate transport system ATPase subunit
MVKQICNRAIVMHKGEILGDGTPSEMVPFYLQNIVHKQTSLAVVPSDSVLVENPV